MESEKSDKEIDKVQQEQKAEKRKRSSTRSSTASTNKKAKVVSNASSKHDTSNSEDSSEEEIPLGKRKQSTSSITQVKRETESETSQSEEDSSDDFQEEAPLKTRKAAGKKVVQKKKSVVSANSVKSDVDDSSEEEIPLKQRRKSSVASSTKRAIQKKKPVASSGSEKSGEDSSDEMDEVPLKKRKKSAASTTTKIVKKSGKKAALKESDNGNDSDKPASKKGKAKNKPSPKKMKVKEEVEDNGYKWWLDDNKDSSVKWNTLQHAGPLFPPAYEPHGVKMKYDGREVELNPDAEEVASFFAALLGTDHAANPTFKSNFFKDFLAICKRQKEPPCPIREFDKCDFTPIFDYLQEQRDKKKLMTKEEKAALKAERAEIDAVYGWAFLNGRKEKVGNYRIEPPGLFRGRGAHPKTGSLKLRLLPEQVTINIGKDEKVPEPPAGHKWEKVIHDNSVTWLAMWKDNVNDSIKYIFLAANSSLKGQSDFKKFEKARELKKLVDGIRENYTAELKDKAMAVRQRATAIYLIDRFALRAGNEKGEDEADTVGCCSLRFEHISLEPPNTVIFDFLGKDSIRYYNEVQVDEQVFKNLKIFKKEPKTEGDPLFDRLNTSILNKYLSTFMPGLTGKVFRTFNASFTFQEELKKTPIDGTVQEKILAYNRANREVAVLCNHQRSVPKGHGNQMGKIKEKVDILKYEKSLVRSYILEKDPKLGKKKPEYKEDESDFHDNTKEQVKIIIKQAELDRLRKKLERRNEKITREKTGEELLSEKEIAAQVKDATKKAGAPGLKERLDKLSIDRLEKRYDTLVDKIRSQKMSLIDKEEGKTTALGTSKINYIDPRISVAWCNKNDVPIEKIFNASLKDKFRWAMDLEEGWEF